MSQGALRRPPGLLPASEVTLSKDSLLPLGPLSVPPEVESHFLPALHPSVLCLFSSQGPGYPQGPELFPEKLPPPSGGSLGSDGGLTVRLPGTEPLGGPRGSLAGRSHLRLPHSWRRELCPVSRGVRWDGMSEIHATSCAVPWPWRKV